MEERCEVFQFGDGRYLLLQTCDDGYDYTIFDSAYLEIDGGVYDDPSETFENVLSILIDENDLFDMQETEIDYDDFMSEVESVEDVRFRELMTTKM